MSEATILCERLRSPPLVAEQFTGTKFSSATEKAKHGNAILRFIAQGMPSEKFSKALYERVSMMWGNIAHYNISGFRSVWFEDADTRHRFLKNIVEYPCWGDPAFTWSDVEREIGLRVRDSLLVRAWERRAISAKETAERTLLATLMKKHGMASVEIPVARPGTQLGLF